MLRIAKDRVMSVKLDEILEKDFEERRVINLTVGVETWVSDDVLLDEVMAAFCYEG